jgi:uncharacterized membrane protein YczE
LDVADNHIPDVGEHFQLFGREQVDHVAANTAEMSWRGRRDGPEPVACQDHNRAPPVLVSSLPADQAALFHPQDLMGEATLRPLHVLGKLGDPPRPFVGFDQVREHRVVGHRQPRFFAQLTGETTLEEPERIPEPSPSPVFEWVEPASSHGKQDSGNIHDASCISIYMMSHEIALQDKARHGVGRVPQLGVGLVLYGLSVALMLSAGLGVDSWDVFHQGLAGHLDLSFGWVVNGVSLVVLAGWIPLGQRPGVGTVANAVVVGLVADAALAVLPQPRWLPWQLLLLVVGIVINALATGLYIGAGLGPGPRDGLMTGIAARTGGSIRSVRTVIELVVLSAGWALGGPAGLGTVLYAVSIGPLSQVAMARFSFSEVTT